MALQPISSLGIAGPLSGTMQPDNFGAPADWVPGNGPPPGMTWSETKGQWMPSGSVVGAMPGPNIAAPINQSFTPLPTFAPGMDPINNFDASGNPTQKSTTTPPPDLGNVNLNDFATGGGRLNPLTGEFNAAGLGSPVGYDQFGQSLGYNPPSSPAPINQSFTPLPTFAPGMDPINNFDAFGNQTKNIDPYGFTPPSSPAPINQSFTPLPTFAPGMDPVVPDAIPQQQPYMPIMGDNQNVGILNPALGQEPRPMNNPAPIPQQPAPTPNAGGLGALLTPQQPAPTPNAAPLGSLLPPQPSITTTSPINSGGLNSLAKPQTPRNTGLLRPTQPFNRKPLAPRVNSAPPLRVKPKFKRSFPISVSKPPFGR